MSGPLDSAKIPTAQVVGGTYNVTAPAPVDGQSLSLQQDANGNLLVNIAAGGDITVATVKIEDTAGNPITTTSGALNVDVTSPLPAGTNVIGHVIADTGSTTAVTGNVTVVQPTGTNLHAVIDSGTITAVTAITNPLPAGTNVIGHVIADTGSTTAVTGNVTVVQPTGTNLHTVVDSGTITTVSAVTAITNPLPAGTNVIGHVITDSGSVTNATLSAETTKVIGTVNQGTSPWVVSGAVTSTGTDNIASWGGVAVAAATASAAVGTEAAPVTRPLLRKVNDLLYTSAIAANATYTSAWFDALAEGSSTISLSYYFANGGWSSGAMRVDQTDDPTQTQFLTTLFTPVNQVYAIQTLSLGYRYFRIRFVNGATIQTAPIIAVNALAVPMSVSLNQYNPSSGVFGALGVSFINGNTLVDGIAASWLNATTGSGGNSVMGVLNMSSTGTGATTVMNRMPNKFNTASVAATATGNTAVWTPATGKKFRLMRFIITAQGLAATASAVVTVSFQDATTGITFGTFDVDVPATVNLISGVDIISGGWIDIGNGFLSAAANNVLNFNISAAGAGTLGTYRINVAGCEE